MEKLENLWDKISSICCKWSSWNAPGTQSSWCHPFLVISLFSCSAPGVIRNWTPQHENRKIGKFVGQNQLNLLQMVQLECRRPSNPCVSSIFGDIPFLLFSPLGNKELASPAWKWKSLKICGTKSAQPAANCPVWMPQALEPLCVIHFWWFPFSLVQPLG